MYMSGATYIYICLTRKIFNPGSSFNLFPTCGLLCICLLPPNSQTLILFPFLSFIMAFFIFGKHVAFYYSNNTPKKKKDWRVFLWHVPQHIWPTCQKKKKKNLGCFLILMVTSWVTDHWLADIACKSRASLSCPLVLRQWIDKFVLYYFASFRMAVHSLSSWVGPDRSAH